MTPNYDDAYFQEPLDRDDPIFFEPHHDMTIEFGNRLAYQFTRAHRHAEAVHKGRMDEEERKGAILAEQGSLWYAAKSEVDAESMAMVEAGRSEEADKINWTERLLDRLPSPIPRTSGIWSKGYQARRDARNTALTPPITPPIRSDRTVEPSLGNIKMGKTSRVRKLRQRRPATRSRLSVAHVSLHNKRGKIVLEDEDCKIMSVHDWSSKDLHSGSTVHENAGSPIVVAEHRQSSTTTPCLEQEGHEG